MGSEKLKVLSLFSGQGGLDIGVENAGLEVICAIENNPFACDTLRKNRLIAHMNQPDFQSWFDSHMQQRCFQSWSDKEKSALFERLHRGVGKRAHFSSTEVFQEDIRNVDPQDVMEHFNLTRGELALIAGGPPCQSFSRSGKQESIKDERGQLFLDFVRFVDVMRPRWFLFENVKGITMARTAIPQAYCASCGHSFRPLFQKYADHKNTGLRVPCKACKSLETTICETQEIRGGAADIIEAEFAALGYKCHAFILEAAEFGVPQFRERFFIVGSRDGEPYLPPMPVRASAANQASLFSGTDVPRTVWETLFNQVNPYHHKEIDPKQAVLWVKNVVRPHDEPVTWSLHRPAPTIGAHQSAKLAIAPFGVPEEQIMRQQWHTLGRRQGDTPPVYVEHSYLSDEDLLKLQTFPDYWFVAGTRMERAFQIGNAVPPLLAEAVVLSMFKLSRVNAPSPKKAAA